MGVVSGNAHCKGAVLPRLPSYRQSPWLNEMTLLCELLPFGDRNKEIVIGNCVGNHYNRGKGNLYGSFAMAAAVPLAKEGKRV